MSLLSAYTKLVILGGQNYYTPVHHVEGFDLTSNETSCAPLSNFPGSRGGMAVGVIDGLIKSCGHDDDYRECFDFDPVTNMWTKSESLLYPRDNARASFIDGKWLVSGDDATTEMWTDNHFVRGPDLPFAMTAHCQLTVNSTHVYFVNFNDRPAFLLDWQTQTFTEMPPYNDDRYAISCGLINNPENGPEVVVASKGTSEIFNFESLTWRVGPDTVYSQYAGYAQVGDTFVMIGGLDGDARGKSVNDVHMFDHLNYEWAYMGDMEVGRQDYPGVVAVPDDFVSCD